MVEHANNNDRHRLEWSQGHKNLGRSKTVIGNWGKLRKLLTDVFVDKAYTVTTYQAITSTEEKTARKNLQGFFLGGPTKHGSRSNNGIAYRVIITLDIDDMIAEQFEDWVSRKAGKLWQWEFVAVETRSSTDHAPRFRLVFPLTGKLDHEQYNAASRILGSLLFDDEEESMRAVDDVSFRFAQLMFLPTASKGQDLQVIHNEGKILNAHKLLKQWSKKTGYDWTDHSFLPYNPDRGNKAPTAPGTTAEDPFEKDGIIGAFCRAYPIEDAMATFLPGVYEETSTPSELPRYSYTGGGSSNGAVVYEDGRFLYSNHGSDPVSEQLVNSWDLVRTHLFADKDKEAHGNTSPSNMPSNIAMVKLAEADPAVKKELATGKTNPFDDYDEAWEDEIDEDLNLPSKKKTKKQKDRSKSPSDTSKQIDDLEDLLGPAEPDEDEDEEDDDWKLGTVQDSRGNPTNAQVNVTLYTCNDPRFKGAIAYDEFQRMVVATRQIKSKKIPLPSDPFNDFDRDALRSGTRWWSDSDDQSIQMILSAAAPTGYEIEAGKEKIVAAVNTAAKQNRVHPIRDRLDEWHEMVMQGNVSYEERLEAVETWAIRYLRLPDDVYHRESALMLLVAAVARIYEPGCKFDQVVIMSGGGGIRKSEVVKVLSLRYFSELSDMFDRTDKMVESMQGAWFCEMPEVQALRKNDHNLAKQFISTTHDQVRLAYGRNVARYPRQALIVGTANEFAVLKDPTGNRRYWPWRLENKFTKHTDPIDTEALEAELPFLYGTVVEYYKRWRKKQPKGDLKLDLISDEAHQIQDILCEESRQITVLEVIAQEIGRWAAETVTEGEVISQDRTAAKFIDENSDGDQLYVRNHFTAEEAYKALSQSDMLRPYRNIDSRSYAAALSQYTPAGWTQCTGKRIGRFAAPTTYYVRCEIPEKPPRGFWTHLPKYVPYEEPEEDDIDDEINEMLG